MVAKPEVPGQGQEAWVACPFGDAAAYRGFMEDEATSRGHGAYTKAQGTAVGLRKRKRLFLF